LFGLIGAEISFRSRVVYMAALGNYFADSDVGVDLILIEVPESY
jgi:hypothetical protein